MKSQAKPSFEVWVAWLRSLTLPPWIAVRVRFVLSCIIVLVVAHLATGRPFGEGYRPLAKVLSQKGLTADPNAARAVALQRKGRAPQRFVFRALEHPDMGDVWLASAVVSERGEVAALEGPHNLTRTASADESVPVTRGRHALFARSIEGEVVALELLDLAGEPKTDQGILARVQRGITNLQQTGSWWGVGRRAYALRIAARSASISASDDGFVVMLDGERIVIDPAVATPREGADRFEVRTHATVVTDLVPWLVDTVRAISWVGPERIAWLENRVFALRDSLKQAYHSVNAVDHEAEVSEELGAVTHTEAAREKVERLAVPNPDSGWPPPAVPPIATPAVEGEGAWLAIVDDPHVRSLPSGAPVFYQTFLRPDPERLWARVYLTTWDPRLVQLNIVAGTEEPVSATGETGSGRVPRDPETLRRLVGAFNGGFQAVHGEFGMMAEGRVYLPPKPWAATVAIFDDGRVGMGSWPGPENRRVAYDEARAVAELPADMVAFRQNLTSLVEEGRFNPWGRWWWGAAPQNKSEQTLTQRSALCFTEGGFMVYAWGDSMSPEALGESLVAARCVRALHLDMNAGHSGMELYNVLAADEPRLSIDSKANHRFEGSISGLPGYAVRARRAVTSMGLPLPRYIHPDPRDFFYHTLKPGLETTRTAGEVRFDSADLPHAGWPPALARAALSASRLIRIDPARAVPTLGEVPGGEVILADLRVQAEPADLLDVAVFSTKVRLGRHYSVGIAPEGAVVLARGQDLRERPDARMAIGVDRDGLLVYGETSDPTEGALDRAMRAAGVEAAVALAGGKLGLHFREGVLEADGVTLLREGEPAVRFVANPAPAVEVMFPDNKPKPYGYWAQLQDQRVRYFRTKDPTARAPEGALE